MALTQLPSGLETLLIEADFPSTRPLTVFSYWIEPALLQQWWPQQAELQPRTRRSALSITWLVGATFCHA